MATRQRGLCREGAVAVPFVFPQKWLCVAETRRHAAGVASHRMPSNPPFPFTPAGPEQRLLAAVVFTDASGFSARAQAEEATAVGLLEQDFVVMRELSQELSGTVLKSTGDGLLLYFTSAVHAVSWALRVQRIFAGRARIGAAGEVFRHRIGIHVGDVFRKEDDVMGDGVNIAARVEAEAPPGGICISQTVYEVVKNKMELHVIRLEPRKLKNIREHIQLYHVLLEEPRQPAYAPAEPMPVARAKAPPPAKSQRLVWPLLALAGIAGGVLLMLHLNSEHETELARSQAAQAALGKLLAEGKGRAVDPDAPAVAARAPAQVDFATLTTNRPAEPSAGAAFTEAKAAAATLDGWVRGQLQRYSKDRPLAVRDPRGAMQDTLIYGDAHGRVAFVMGRAERKRDWPTLSPEEQGMIVLGALRAAPDPAMTRAAEAFAYIYGLPDMAAALLRERSAQALFPH
jgi:class 3 adenylate cyclase